MKNKLRKIVSVFCVLAIVITAFAAVGRDVKAEIERQTEYTEKEIENQFLGLLTSAGLNMYVSVQEDVNGNYVISFGSDNPGYYECTLTPTQVDYFMKSSDNINPMLGKEQNINEEFERDFLNPFVATDGNIHMAWQEKADNNFEIFYTNDEGKQYENTLKQVRENLDGKTSENMDKAIKLCLEGNYKHSIVWVHKSIKILEKTENTETINILVDSVMDFAKTNILYAEYDLTFNNTYIQEAYDKYYLAVDKYEKGNYDSAVQQFKNSYLKIVEAYEEKGETYMGVDFGETVRISYTDYDSVVPEVFLNDLISVGWMEVLPEENHVYYARSSNNGVSWWYFDATVHASSYLTYWGLSSSIVKPCCLIIIGIVLLLLLLLIILIILALIIILIWCHFFYGILRDRTYGPIDDPYLNIFSPYDTVSVGGNIFNTPRLCGGDGNGNGGPEPAPDLRVTNVWFSDTYVLQEDPTTVYATIKNQGSAIMTGTVYAEFRYGTSYDQGVTIGEVQIPAPLYAGHSTTVDVSWTPTNTGASFDTTVWVMADSRGGVTEGDEGNNIGSTSCHVFNPTADDDGDGMSNLYEIKCGVDVGGWQDPLIYNVRYAVLVVGTYYTEQQYQWYLSAVQNMYDILHNSHGYTDTNINYLVTLSSGYNEPSGFDTSLIDDEATETNIQNVFNNFKTGGTQEMSSNDFLIVCWVNHGGDDHYNSNTGEDTVMGTDAHDTYFPLKNGDKVYDSELATYVSGISAARTVFILQPCNSGGFVNDLSISGRIIGTAVRENEVEGGWIETVITGFNGAGDTDPDVGNNNGYVSIQEAWKLAAHHVFSGSSVHSQLDDNGDGLGHDYMGYDMVGNDDGGYDPNTSSKDGYLAARTYL